MAGGAVTSTNHFQLGKPIGGKAVAKVEKDGSKICQSFQHGQCKSKPPCPQGQHRCGLVVKKERVCGAPGHGASACKTQPKLSWRGPEEEGATSSGVSVGEAPLMADLMSGPTAPLSKAFLWRGWRCLPVDWLLDPSHDLSHPIRQRSLSDQLQSVDFICAAMDCSTKSRAREIPRVFDDGRPAPRPLRSEEFPEGLPGLSPSQQSRVDTDNKATAFLLDQIQQLALRGGGSVRENPWRSLHWFLSQEQAMMASGLWQDKRYSACCRMGARAKSQCLRHNLDEISQWPVLDCHHYHDPSEWDPYTLDGQRVYPSHEEAEYTAPLAFAIAVAASWWAARVGKAKLHVPRMPAFQCHGRRDHSSGRQELGDGHYGAAALPTCSLDRMCRWHCAKTS